MKALMDITYMNRESGSHYDAVKLSLEMPECNFMHYFVDYFMTLSAARLHAALRN
jgi:hypothetical protein